jgi:uncharacterized protein YndB with AHSA1/START domain
MGPITELTRHFYHNLCFAGPVGRLLSAPPQFEETAKETAKETAMTEPFVVRRETQIAAPPATVFAFLTDPEKILSWMGTEAETQLHSGGLYLVKLVSGRVARGAFREVVPVHRLAYSFGWDGDAEVPPGSGLVEIDLVDRDGGTLLRMAHSGLPSEAQCANHTKGWVHYLGRLAVTAAGRDPGADPGVHNLNA